MPKSKAIHLHPIILAAAALGLGFPIGCDNSNLRTGSNQGSGGTGGVLAADAAMESGGTAGQGEGGVGTGGVGTGGLAPPPTGTGGATGGTGLGGSRTGGVPGTGGSVPPGSGGSTGPGTGGSGPIAATVNLDRTKQTIDGFGITNTWAPALSDADADALFDATQGLGLSILRVGMGPDGNPMSSNIYSDIKKAKARGVTAFIASVYSAPTTCKDSSKHLLLSCYESWASTMAAFPDKVKQNAGADLYALSVQNEPDYSPSGDNNTMLYSAEEMVAFIKVLGPKLRALSPQVLVIAPDATEWGRLWTNQSALGASDLLGGKYDYGHALAKDLEAWAQVDIVGAQLYDTLVALPWPSDVLEQKPVWMTEVSGVKGWPEAGPSSDINNGVAVAGWIHDAIVNGNASAWIWFWYKVSSSSTDDNEGLLLKNGTDTKRHYTLGNFSRFIRPGTTRVDITGNLPSDVLLSAYKSSGTDSTFVIVAINKGSATATVPISILGGAAPVTLTTWVTSENDNLNAGPEVPVSGGSFTAVLASMTVTTFVGK
jgi:glucuronoarabinoxylan endo-1,4-beta-xylanase